MSILKYSKVGVVEETSEVIVENDVFKRNSMNPSLPLAETKEELFPLFYSTDLATERTSGHISFPLSVRYDTCHFLPDITRKDFKHVMPKRHFVGPQDIPFLKPSFTNKHNSCCFYFTHFVRCIIILKS